jgi:Cu/Ag efflux pump CusA
MPDRIHAIVRDGGALGMLPIVLGAGAGSESRRPLEVAVVDGLAFSQFHDARKVGGQGN